MFTQSKSGKMPQNSIAMMQNFPHEMEHNTTFLFTSESVGEGHPGKCFGRVKFVNRLSLSDNTVRCYRHRVSSNIPLILSAKLC